MKIAVVGLGYVGLVSSACLANDGHSVIGVDLDEKRVDCVNAGEAPIVEPGLLELIKSGVASKTLRASKNLPEALDVSDIVIICVGTPSRDDGSLETHFLEAVSRDIAHSLKKRTKPLSIVYRSTMLPGTIANLLIPILEKYSSKVEGRDYFVMFNPEFLRETTAIEDYYSPPKTVLGCRSVEAARSVAELYDSIEAPFVFSSIETAEMVKYVDNCWHAVKVTFANEIGQVCKRLEIDSHEVMDIFVKDEKLNISSYYMRPGFAYGGSCLPKDLSALKFMASQKAVSVPMISATSLSNDGLIESVFQTILSKGGKRVLFYGVAFKAGTDDTRESPFLKLAEMLIAEEHTVQLYDPSLNGVLYDSATIAPHTSVKAAHLTTDLALAAEGAELILICHRPHNIDDLELLAQKCSTKLVVDLVRVEDSRIINSENYHGLAW